MSNANINKQVYESVKRVQNSGGKHFSLFDINLEKFDWSTLPPLPNVTTVSANNCSLSSLNPSFFEYFKQIQVLNINDNILGNEGARQISQNLKNLTDLRINDNNIGAEGAKHIAQNLKKLRILSIAKNPISKEGTKYIAQNLLQLENLIIYGCQIGDEGITYIANNLKQLDDLSAHTNNISDLGAVQVSIRLKNLTKLVLASNNIGDWGATQIVKNLKKLQRLWIQNNKISDDGLKAIADSTLLFASIDNNIPNEIPKESSRYLDDLRAHLKSVKISGRIKWNINRLVLCGNSMAGKSSLAGKLENIETKNPEKEERTHGIQHWRLSKEISSEYYTINIWDFGGQDYYHATHAAALNGHNSDGQNDHSIYLLLWHEPTNDDILEDGQNMPVDYWIGFIEQMAGKKEIEIVQTFADVSKRTFPKSTLINATDSLLNPGNFHYLSLKTELLQNIDSKERKYWDRFSTYLNELIQDKNQGSEYSKAWKQIRDKTLPTLAGSKPVYNKEELKQKFLENVQNEEALQYEGLLAVLRNCGEILYWKDDDTSDPELLNNVVVNIEQFHKEIYNELLSNTVREQRGEFIPPEEYAFHTAYLLANGLVFQKEDSEVYVAPQYLPEEPLIAHFRDLIPLTLILRFPYYMPRYLITKFIVMAYGEDKMTSYWKYGCISKMDGAKYMVCIDADKQEIYIHIQEGRTKYELLKKLFYYFGSFGEYNPWKKEETLSEEELAKNAEIEQKQPEELVKEEVQISEDEKLFSSFGDIRQAIQERQMAVKTICGHYTKVSTTMQQLAKAALPRPKKIFISYSKKDLIFCQELEKAFANLQRQGLVEVFYDRRVEAGDGWDPALQKKLKEADIILCLLSQNFVATDYIMSVEMRIAEEKKDIDKVVPVFISNCDLDGSFLNGLQSMPTIKQEKEGTEKAAEVSGICYIGIEDNSYKRQELYGIIVSELTPIIKR